VSIKNTTTNNNDDDDDDDDDEYICNAFPSVLKLLVERQEWHPACIRLGVGLLMLTI